MCFWAAASSYHFLYFSVTPTIYFGSTEVFPLCLPTPFLEVWLCDPVIDCFSRDFKRDGVTPKLLNNLYMHVQ